MSLQILQLQNFSCFGDILGGNKNLNASRDHIHAPFRNDLLSMCLGLVTIQQCIKFEISTLTTKIWNATKNAEIGVVLGLGVTQGHRQHSYSI